MKKKIAEITDKLKMIPATGQCWILKRVPKIKSIPVINPEIRRKSLFLLWVSFQRTTRVEGIKINARMNAPRTIIMLAGNQCWILNSVAKPNIIVPAMPEIFIVFFIFLYFESTA